MGEIRPLVPVRIMPAQGSVSRPTRSRPDSPLAQRSAMNANVRFLARDAHVDDAAVQPFPSSSKVFVQGSRPDLRVPMREIAQSDTPASFGAEKNPPIVVYDTSGPYTDPAAAIDIRAGLLPLRAGWIEERDDTVALAEPSSAYGRARRAASALSEMRFHLRRQPRRARDT